MGKAHDGVHGGANFVAHIGQKITLGKAGRLRGFFGQEEGLGALFYQALQVVTVTLQLCLNLFALRHVNEAGAHQLPTGDVQTDQTHFAHQIAAIRGAHGALDVHQFPLPGAGKVLFNAFCNRQTIRLLGAVKPVQLRANQLLGWAAKERDCAGIGICNQPGFGIYHQNGFGRLLYGDAVALFAFAQGGLGHFSFFGSAV